MKHFMGIFMAWLLLTHAAFGQDTTPAPNGKDGKTLPMLPPPTLAAPPGPQPGPRAIHPVPVLPCPGPFQHLNGKTVVFVADGVSDATKLYDNLRTALEGTRICVVALNVRWCRHNDHDKDHLDRDSHRAAGYKLACTVLAIRKDAPAARIVFMGHSTGTAVVLAAAEMLPPASIDRIFLFASFQSSGYYLKPALCAARGGIDNFYSKDDGALEWVEGYLPTADGHFGPSAGRVGFVVPRLPAFVGPETQKMLNPDVALYANLRQFRWTDELAHAGHGGHASFLWESFLRNHIVPQLACTH